ncbi:MAG TPA: hypothetical protein VK631_20665 [Solirubrobacteraceae bacterium]|nr:hypothetical protein [Solirubrobacteraceae bacterium]
MADPIFSERGAEVRIEGGSGKLNPEDPKLKAAEEACAQFMKGGKGGK